MSVRPSEDTVRILIVDEENLGRLNQTDTAQNEEGYSCCEVCLMIISIFVIICTFPFSLFACIKIVQEYERAVIFRLGRVSRGGPKGPGVIFIFPCIDRCVKIDLRTVSFDVPAQEVLTKDGVAVHVDAVVYFRITDPTKSVNGVDDATGSTKLLTLTSLRTILGMHTLQEIFRERKSISRALKELLDHATGKWGMTVERVEVKEVPTTAAAESNGS